MKVLSEMPQRMKLPPFDRVPRLNAVQDMKDTKTRTTAAMPSPRFIDRAGANHPRRRTWGHTGQRGWGLTRLLRVGQASLQRQIQQSRLSSVKYDVHSTLSARMTTSP